MKHLKITGLCLASMLVMGMALTGNASATKFLVCLEGSNASNTKYEDSSCTKAKAGGSWESVELGSKKLTIRIATDTILLLDTKAAGGSSGVRCGSITEGVGIAESAKVILRKSEAANPKTECERVEGGCKAGEVEKLKSAHLPWKEEFFETESSFRSKIEGDGAGEPAWEVGCNTILGKVVDKFETGAGEPEEQDGFNDVSHGVLLARTDLQTVRRWNDAGGVRTGIVIDTLLLLAWFGTGFSLVGG